MWRYENKKNGGRRRLCKLCKKSWSIARNIIKKLRRSSEQWLLDRSTLRRIEERTSIHYSAKWKQVQKYADHVPTPLDNLRKNIAKASKILLLDGKQVNVRGKSICIHIAYDTWIGVINYWIDDSENKTAYHYLLRQLRDEGYIPICVVSDEHTSITTLIESLTIAHQLCVFHLLQSLRQLIIGRSAFREEIPDRYKVIYSRIKGIFKSKDIETMVHRLQLFRKISWCWRTNKHKKILKWFWVHLNKATVRLSFTEKIPNTNNLLENLNGQIEQRLKTFRGVKSEDSLRKILNILFYFRKFK